MKKIIFIFITILTLTGCDYTPRKEFRVRLENDMITNMDKYHFNYNGHQYIMFAPYSALRDNTVIHDPDCPCHKK